MSVLYWVALGVFGFTGLLWALMALGFASRVRDMEFRVHANRVPDAPTHGPLVSVIIPARNEEGNIGACIDAVLAQTWQDLEVVVLNDRSEDGTAAEIAERSSRDDRVRAIEGKPRPDGWMGKVWACHVAQQEARGEFLLFVDADVRLNPEAIRQSIAYMEEQSLGAMSAYGFLTLVTFWERVIQPAVGSLIMLGNDPREVNDPEKKDKAMANGQFILARRSAYDAVGGHASISGEILDDVGFSRRCKEEGQLYHLVYGRELFSCRMYTSFGEIWEGWTKNLFAGLGYRIGVAVFLSVMIFLQHVAPFLGLPVVLALASQGHLGWADPLVLVLVWNVLAAYGLNVLGLRASGYRVGYFWTYPLGMVVVVGLFLNSARRIVSGKGVTWKGRTYTVTGRDQK